MDGCPAISCAVTHSKPVFGVSDKESAQILARKLKF